MYPVSRWRAAESGRDEAEPATVQAQAAWGAVDWLTRLTPSGGGGATAWGQGHAAQLEQPSASHRDIGGAREAV